MTTPIKYKQYPKYKPSDIDWLSNIPEGWEVEYLKNLGFFASSGIDKKIVEGEPLVQMVNYTDIYGNDSLMIDKNRELMTVSCPAWKISESNLIKGDLVFTPSSETIEDIGLSALIFENLENTVFSYHVIRFRFSKNFKHEFKKYWCNNDFVLQQFSKAAKGTTRQIIDRNDFKNIYVVVPSIEEQSKIADFLDRETAKIDEVVGKRQKLIDLLKEKRQALITHVVTKGVDPKVKMKPSGIDWLGDIPESWEVKKLKYISEITLGKMLQPEQKSDLEYLKPYLRAENIRWEKVDIDGVNEMWFNPNEINNLRLQKNDLLVSEGGEVGRTAIWKTEMEECYIQNSVNRVRAIKSITDAHFLLYFFEHLGGAGFLEAFVNRVSIAHLTREKLKEVEFTLPTLKEQKEIIAFLDRETAKIDEMMKKVETQIEKLQEYRQALITSVVTGKIMVN